MRRCPKAISSPWQIRFARPQTRRIVVLAGAIALVAVGLLAGTGVARRGFLDELHGALPGATWTGDRDQSNGVYPLFVMESFSAPSVADAEAELARAWVPVATTRSGAVSVFRQGDRTLYIDRALQPPRLELLVGRSCAALSAPFPLEGFEDWLQFGVSPGLAMDHVRHPLVNLEMDPCPATGYWLASVDRLAVVFRSPATGASLVLSSGAGTAGDGDSISVVGIAPMRLQQSPAGRRLEWSTSHAYSYMVDAPMQALVATACRTQRPDWYCDLVVR